LPNGDAGEEPNNFQTPTFEPALRPGSPSALGRSLHIIHEHEEL
jgi:hypothetical protein